MTQWLYELVYTLRGFLQTFGAMNLFFLRIVSYSPRTIVRRFPLVIQQVYNSGAQSLVLIMVCGLFVGMVLGLQGYENLAKFNSEDSVGTVAALSLLQELGPVLAALLWSGRAGTALASEIGLMRATDQLSAMEMMAVDPLKRVVVPRFLGGVVSMPLLAAIFSGIGIFGAYISGVVFLGVDGGVFFSQMQANVEPVHIWQGIIKSCVFGVAASLMAVFEGYNSIPTAEGVGRATTRTVVLTAISVLVLDYMITAAVLVLTD